MLQPEAGLFGFKLTRNGRTTELPRPSPGCVVGNLDTIP